MTLAIVLSLIVSVILLAVGLVGMYVAARPAVEDQTEDDLMAVADAVAEPDWLKDVEPSCFVAYQGRRFDRVCDGCFDLIGRVRS